MLDGISLAALGDIGSSGLLVLFVILLMLGKIVPVSTVNREQKKYDDALARADSVIATLSQTNLELTLAAKTSTTAAVVAASRPLPPESSPPENDGT